MLPIIGRLHRGIQNFDLDRNILLIPHVIVNIYTPAHRRAHVDGGIVDGKIDLNFTFLNKYILR